MGVYNSQRARAYKQIELEIVPDSVIADASTSQVFVGANNLCRIEGTGAGYVMFQDEGDTTTPDATTKETLKTEAKMFIVRSTKDYIRTSSVMRIEVSKD